MKSGFFFKVRRFLIPGKNPCASSGRNYEVKIRHNFAEKSQNIFIKKVNHINKNQSKQNWQ